jgi:hydrocephalus-inducing protein
VYLTTWVCDFGNVIVGTTQKKVLKFKNIGEYPIEMGFDTRVLKATDYKITPEKSKLATGEEISINITLATKKNSKFGKLASSVVLEVKNGAKYKIDLLSNLTVPEIQIDSNPEGIVDFGKVLCGQRKIVTLRFLNLKEISCDWALNLRDPVGADKEEVKFELIPSSGKIASGSFQIVQAIFFPSQ